MTESRRVLERFTLGREIGRGGQGVVWEAHDEVARRRVAVKQLIGFSAQQLSHLRREVAALRLLRFPGVVHLIDAGAEGNTGFVAMEFIDGAPLPELGPVSWETIEPVLLGVLQTLSRIHAAGIVHRDIKPANIVVDARKGPIVLDLGIAGGRALAAPDSESLAGTPRYMAPALFDGSPPSPATDLYALAYMTFEMLTGQRLRERGLPLGLEPLGLDADGMTAALAEHAPAAAADLLSRILAAGGVDTLDAEEALRLLAPTVGSKVEFAVPDTISIDSLEEMFDAQERIVRHRSTAARILMEATDGKANRVVPELTRWASLGIGRIREGRLALEELDVVRLEKQRGIRYMLSDADLATTWQATGLEGLADAAFAALPKKLERGELREALAVLPTILSTLQQTGREQRLPEILGRWLLTALIANDREAIHLLLHEIDRSAITSEVGASVAAIGVASLAAMDGAFDRAAERLAVVAPTGAEHEELLPEVGLARHAVNLYCARQVRDRERIQEALRDARAWQERSGAPAPELDGWEGWIAFHEGDFERAEALHHAAAARFTGARQATYLLDAGAAALERGAFDAAATAADRAETALRGQRHPFATGRMEWLRRATSYRSGRATSVDDELVASIEGCGVPHVAGLTLLTEAAIAWRSRAADRALELALRSADVFGQAGLHSLAAAPLALAHACGEPCEWTRIGAAIGRVPPAVAAQLTELWLRSGDPIPADAASDVANAIRAAKGMEQDVRREVLALSECALANTLVANHNGRET